MKQKEIAGFKGFNFIDNVLFTNPMCGQRTIFMPGEIKTENCTPKICERGFHFCKNLKKVFLYYGIGLNRRFTRVISKGDVHFHNQHDNISTNSLYVDDILSNEEVLEIINAKRIYKNKKIFIHYNFGNSICLLKNFFYLMKMASHILNHKITVYILLIIFYALIF